MKDKVEISIDWLFLQINESVHLCNQITRNLEESIMELVASDRCDKHLSVRELQGIDHMQQILADLDIVTSEVAGTLAKSDAAKVKIDISPILDNLKLGESKARFTNRPDWSFVSSDSGKDESSGPSDFLLFR